MDKTKLSFKTDLAGCVLAAALLVSVAGCVGYVGEPRGEVRVDGPVFVAHDDYTYYPGYNVYYSSSRHQYAYQEGGAWVSRPAPQGVSVNVLVASPSVKMDFHDSPANHHATVVQKYPRNWTPPHANQGRKDGPSDEHGR
jgi:hypothetical protein